MPRSLSLLVLLALAGCAPAPELLSPRVKPPPMPKPWPSATLRIIGPGVDHGRGMPVVVLRPDTTIDRAMVVQGGGTTPRLRGPAKVVPVNPLADSVQHSAP